MDKVPVQNDLLPKVISSAHLGKISTFGGGGDIGRDGVGVGVGVGGGGDGGVVIAAAVGGGGGGGGLVMVVVVGRVW